MKERHIVRDNYIKGIMHGDGNVLGENFDPEYHGDYFGQLGWRGDVPLGNIQKKKNAIRARCKLDKLTSIVIKAYDVIKNNSYKDETWRGQIHRGDYYRDLIRKNKIDNSQDLHFINPFPKFDNVCSGSSTGMGTCHDLPNCEHRKRWIAQSHIRELNECPIKSQSLAELTG